MVFWGLVLENNKWYQQKVQKDFRISQAVLEPKEVKENDIVSLLAQVNDKSFLVCNFCIKHGILQVPLDLIFTKGEKIVFSITGKSEDTSVHLTGYTLESLSSDVKESLDVKPLANLNKAGKLSKTVDLFSGSPSKGKDKENEAPSKKKEKNKLKNNIESKSNEVSPKKEQNKKKQEKKNKRLTLKDLLDSNEDDDEDDYPYNPEEELEEEEGEEEEEEMMDDDEDDEEDDEEEEDGDEEIDIEEEEEENNEDEVMVEDENEWIDLEEENEETSKKKKSAKASKKEKNRQPSPSSAGRTPMVKSDKKRKMEDLSASPTLLDNSLKNKKRKSLCSDSNSDQTSPKNKITKEDQSKESNSSEEKSTKNKKKICMGGVVTEDIVVGSGALAKSGKKLSMYYEGRLKSGKVFDECKSGPCFKFKLGSNEVIKAWEVGILGMKVGGKRKITTPPAMAYGKAGCPPDIPPNSILIFEVELKGVN